MRAPTCGGPPPALGPGNCWAGAACRTSGSRHDGQSMPRAALRTSGTHMPPPLSIPSPPGAGNASPIHFFTVVPHIQSRKFHPCSLKVNVSKARLTRHSWMGGSSTSIPNRPAALGRFHVLAVRAVFSGHHPLFTVVFISSPNVPRGFSGHCPAFHAVPSGHRPIFHVVFFIGHRPIFSMDFSFPVISCCSACFFFLPPDSYRRA